MRWVTRALRTPRRAVRRHPVPLVGAVVAVAALAAVQTSAPGGFRAGAAPAASSCIPSGTDADINAALVGSGAQAVLCPGAVFSLANSVTFTAPNQEIYTQGLPTDSTRAILRVTGSNLTTAISGNNQSGVTVENIQVDGNRPALGPLTGGALLEMGGGGTGQTVQNITAHDTRSWSDMHFIEGTVTNSVPQCQKATIQDNTIGPSGTAAPDAPGNNTWADGISLACGNSMVQGNTIQDATDGGIVVFGAPGSTIQNNTIIAKSQLLFGGINMVDYAPMNGNYTGTVVTHNTIDAAGAFIKIGIAMGQQVWNCTTGTNYGGTVTDNTLEGPYMGYGYAVNGVSNWTVTGNVDNSTHVGTQTAGGCFGSPPASQPAGFQVEKATSSNLQPQFTSAVLTNALGTLNSPPISGGPPPSANLALNQPITASGSQSGYPPTNADDGNTSSYWESTNNAFPQWLQVDLGSAQSIAKIVLDLPPSSAWGARTQTLSVLGSTDGSAFTTIVPSAGYTFDPNTGNTATISFSAATARYVRLNFTANTGWPAGQISEFQVYAASGGGTPSASLTTNPSSMSFGNQTVGTSSSSQAVTVTNTGSAAASISSIAASGDFTQTNACGSSLAAGASCTISVTFTPTATGTRTGAVTITSNATTSPNTVSLTGSGTSSNPNLALNQPVSASGYTQAYVPANAVDGNTSSYWESTDNAFPQWLQVDLGASKSISRIVMDLPPSSAWGTRTQTILIQGSTDGGTYTTLVGSQGYTFDPNTGNTATVTFTANTVRYVKLTFTANTGWPAGQLSELQVYGS